MPSNALVTGAGRGIGAGIARELAAAGWHVTVTGRTQEQVEAVAQEIGGKAIVGDVSKREDVERMVAAAEPLDLLVANAGIFLRDTERRRRLVAHVRGQRSRRPSLLPGRDALAAERGGRIVVVASGSAYLPGGGDTAYGPSKAAAARYAELLAHKLEPKGIKVFAISPGMVRTDMIRDLVPGGRAVDAAGARASARARAGLRPVRRPRRPLHPRRARPARRARERASRASSREDLNAIRLRREA